MNELLKVVLSLSLSGTLLILLLFLPRSLFKERLSKRWQYYIWLVVIARLLFPFAPETNLMARLFQGIDRPTEQMEIVSPYAQQSGIANGTADDPLSCCGQARRRHLADHFGSSVEHPVLHDDSFVGSRSGLPARRRNELRCKAV